MRNRDTILDQLSPKELGVLELLSKGYDNVRIAKALKCGSGTIGQDLFRIYDKLKVHTDFGGKNKRVVAARMYLMATNQLFNGFVIE